MTVLASPAGSTGGLACFGFEYELMSLVIHLPI